MLAAIETLITARFRCSACKGVLRATSDEALTCSACGETVRVIDGIPDFVGGRTDTILNADSYDADHLITEAAPDQYYDRIRITAAGRWPASLGAVLEVGCGTGLFSRALLGRGEARDVVLTDISLAMLQTCRFGMERQGLLAGRRVAFATYSSAESCLHDTAFDTCIGTSALHHIPDVRRFLSDVYRALKPGGRAFFLEPNLRYYRALGYVLSDVMTLLYARDAAWNRDRQALLNVLAEWRRGILHQGDIAFLAQLEDKHMFESDSFADLAQEVGFATAEALPFGPEPTGVGTLNSLCSEIGVAPEYARVVCELARAVSDRHMTGLSRRDASPSLLLWMTKAIGPQIRMFHDTRPEPAQPASQPDADLSLGGMQPRWHFEVTATQAGSALTVTLAGWCLLNVDIAWVRVRLDGAAQDAPVWLPRPDIHLGLNQSGLYGAWNALCCGVQAELTYPALQPSGDSVALLLAIVLSNGREVPVPAAERLTLGQKLELTH